MWVLAGVLDDGNMGVVIADLGTQVFELFHEDVARRLAVVVHIGLVSQAEDEDTGTFDGAALLVEGVGDFTDDEVGHLGVDLAGQFDEAGVLLEFAGLPVGVEWGDGDAVAVPLVAPPGILAGNVVKRKA